MKLLNSKSKLILSVLLLVLIIGVAASVFIKNKKIKNNDLSYIIKVLDEYKGKSEITIYDIEELLKISSNTKEITYDENYDFLEMLYMVLGEENVIE